MLSSIRTGNFPVIPRGSILWNVGELKSPGDTKQLFLSDPTDPSPPQIEAISPTQWRISEGKIMIHQRIFMEFWLFRYFQKPWCIMDSSSIIHMINHMINHIINQNIYIYIHIYICIHLYLSIYLYIYIYIYIYR